MTLFLSDCHTMSKMIFKNFSILTVMLLGCRIKANYLHVGSGPAGGVPSMGVFLRDPSPYLSEFRS